MATKEFSLTPKTVEHIHTPYRTIHTQIPTPESIPILHRLKETEPRSMGGQPPIIWDSGHGSLIRDPYGNQWIDFSSGVLVTSVGHSHPRVIQAIKETLDKHVYHAYCFPTEIRKRLTEKIQSILPHPLERVFLLTTGSEACECAIKLAKTRGYKLGGRTKNIIVSFENGFHGRTMGSQLAGGSPSLKEWIGGEHPDFIQVPFPDGFRCMDTSFKVFEQTLEEKGISPDSVCGVIGETYQGCNATLMPTEYAQELRLWCNTHAAALIFDEVQAGFGRTGKLFGFQHFNIVPDIACFGKGISGGMPLSAVVGTKEIMELYGPGEMTSTHSANPVCSAAALATIEIIHDEDLVQHAARLEDILLPWRNQTLTASNGHIGMVNGCGLVTALQFVQPGTTTPDSEAAWDITQTAVEQGVMLFAPVGVGGATIKINPPLNISEDILREGLQVIQSIVSKRYSQRTAT